MNNYNVCNSLIYNDHQFFLGKKKHQVRLSWREKIKISVAYIMAWQVKSANKNIKIFIRVDWLKPWQLGDSLPFDFEPNRKDLFEYKKKSNK